MTQRLPITEVAGARPDPRETAARAAAAAKEAALTKQITEAVTKSVTEALRRQKLVESFDMSKLSEADRKAVFEAALEGGAFFGHHQRSPFFRD